MAVLLLQERPNAWRRVPSQGDGGVDVVEPADGGYHVYRIKKFAQRLTAGQKAQIKRSLDHVITDPRLDKPVVKWSLVMPLDPTSEDETWFRELVADAPFPCEWLGRIFWDSEAAKFPYVIDYHLRDGKARLVERVRTLGQLISDPEAPVRPGDVASRVQALMSELNKTDPHYRYDMLLTSQPPERSSPPGVVMSQTRGSDESGYVTIDVIARYPQAIEDRPVGGSLSMALVDHEHGLDISEEFRSFLEYGRAFEVPEGALQQVVVDAPGGLGGEFEGGQAVIGPATIRTAAPDRLEIDVLAPGGEVIATITVQVDQATSGSRGLELVGHESEGAFSFETRIDIVGGGGRHAPATWHLRQNHLAGLPAASVLPAARFLHNLCAPNRLRMRLMNGPAQTARAEQPLEPAGGPTDDLALRVTEGLAELQPHCAMPLLIPEAVTQEDMDAMDVAVRLLRGETLTRQHVEIETVVAPDRVQALQQAIASGTPLAIASPLTVTVANVIIPLGMIMTSLSEVRLIQAVPAGADVAMRLSAEKIEECLLAPPL
jgi:hypothetical protein